VIMVQNPMACDIRNWLWRNVVSLCNRAFSQHNVGYRTLCHILFTQPIAMQHSKSSLIRQAISNMSTGMGRHRVGAGEGLNLSSRRIVDTFRQGVPPVPVPPMGGGSRRYDSSPSHQKLLKCFFSKIYKPGCGNRADLGPEQSATSPGDYFADEPGR
jgi:hypothetical protein